MLYTVKPQTLVILIGPSNCGKSRFARLLKSQIKSDYPQSKVNIVSSDNIRLKLIDQEKINEITQALHQQMSALAFDIYYYLIESYMKFPAENDIIIADATNLHINDIIQLTEIAKKYRYNIDFVVFYYNNVDEYFKYQDEFTNKEVTIRHYKRLHKFYKELLNYNKKINGEIYCLRHHVDDIELTYTGLWKAYFNRQYYTKPKRVLAIGDIHGQYEAMKELLLKNDININDEKEIEINSDKIDLLVFVGDYIDKCPYENTVWMIEFVSKNIDKDNVIFLRGNHERFVYNYLNRHKSYLQTSQEIIDKYFNSIKELYNDENTKKIFFKWYPKTLKFVKLPNCIICHAPTNRELLCKINCDNMIKGDLNYGCIPQNYLKYFKQLNSYEPIIVVGHKSTLYPFIYNNLVFIDGGADKGNLLCSCFISKKKTISFKKVYIDSSNAEEVTNFHLLIKQNSHEQKKISFDELESDDLRRLRYLKKYNIKFISGTMPPAWATENNIENIDTVFDYYKKNGVDEVILEPKYMGSRINVYLDCENVEKTKFITRQGFVARITDEQREILLNQCKEWIDCYKKKYNNLPKTIIIDGELLPWRVLGENLIENSFNLYSKLIQRELEILDRTGFDRLYSTKIEKLESICTLSKKDIISNYGHHIYRLCKLIKEFKYVPIDKRRDYLDLFNKQLDLYANPNLPIEIRPFSILKIDDKVLPFETNEQCFKLFNDHEYVIVNVRNKNDREKGKEFFNTLSYDKGYEGVVIKPNQIKSAVFNNIVPYFKVRNQDYLLIIYGYLYKEFYDQFIKTKNRSLNNKILACLQEWNAGIKMLQSQDEKEFVNAYLEFKYGENIELQTDPRL